MKRPQQMRSQVGALLKSCGAAAERVGMATARKVMAKVDGAELDGPARKVVDVIAKGTDRLIAKSPVPIPGLVRDALESMREALGQLSSSIDVVNAGAASLSKDPAGMDPSRRQAMEDARAAFVDLEASDDNGADGAQKKSRRNRSRRGNHRSGHAQDDARQNAPSSQKDRAQDTPSS